MASKTIKGLTVEIGGDTSKLGKALSGVEKQSGKAAAEIKEIDTALKLVPNSEELLIQKQAALAKEIEATSGKLDILKEAERQVQAQFERGEVSEEQLRALQREIVVTTNSLEGYEKAAEDTAKALETAAKSSDKAEDSTEQVGDEAKKAASKMDALGDESEDASGSLNKVGNEAKDAGGKFDAAAVAVGGFIGNLALDVLKSAVSELKNLTEAAAEAVKETAEYGDSIDKASQKMGLSAEKYQEWDYILQHSGSSIDAMKSGMKTLSDAVYDQSDKAVNAFNAIGLSIEDAAKMSQADLFETVITKLQEMPEGAERAAVANDLLSRSAQELGAFLNSSAEDTETLRRQVHELGGVMSDEAVKDAAAYQDSLQDLTTAADGIKRSFASRIIPGAKGAMDELTNVLSGGAVDQDALVSSIGQISDALESTLTDAQSVAETLVPVIGNIIREKLPEVIGMGAEVVTDLVGGILDALPDVLTLLFDAADMLVEKLLEQLPTLYTKLAEAISGSAPVLAERIPQLIQTLVTMILASMPQLIQAAYTILTAIVGMVPVLAQQLAQMLPTVITAMVTALVSNYPVLLAGAYSLLLAILDAIPPIIEALAPLVPTIVTSLIDLLLDNKDELGEAAVEMFMLLVSTLIQVGEKLIVILVTLLLALLNNLGDFGPKLLGQLKQIADGLLGIITGLADKMRNAGHNIMAGLLDGIAGMASSIVNKATEIANSIISAITSPFDIHSPSKKMAWVGQMIDEGLAEGMDSSSDDPIDAMESMARRLFIEAAPLPQEIESQASQPAPMSAPQYSTDPALLGRLDRILQAIEDGKIIALDGDKIVGETIDRIDAALGELQVQSERGVN